MPSVLKLRLGNKGAKRLCRRLVLRLSPVVSGGASRFERTVKSLRQEGEEGRPLKLGVGQGADKLLHSPPLSS